MTDKQDALLHELTNQLNELELQAKISETRFLAARSVYKTKLYKLAAANLNENNYIKHMQQLGKK